MLDRAKLVNLCKTYTTHYFSQFQKEYLSAQNLWQYLCADVPLQTRLSAQETLPYWEKLALHEIQRSTLDYTVYAIDGSQIYPDRHEGFSCYLINIGCVALSYGERPGAFFETLPYLLHEQKSTQVSQELVNARRTRYELEHAVIWSMQHQRNNNLILCDGSLIFWHLSAHEKSVQIELLAAYLKALEDLYQRAVPIIGYISLPQSKELTNIVRAMQDHTHFDYLVDADIIASWLKHGFRTNLFAHRSPLMQQYPEPLRIYFFYMHVGSEIVRIELPAWLIGQVDLIAALVLDQAEKGHGYPVCLAEAHQQAVVTTLDRAFFYQLLQQQSQEFTGTVCSSQKLHKKRRLDV